MLKKVCAKILGNARILLTREDKRTDFKVVCVHLSPSFCVKITYSHW